MMSDNFLLLTLCVMITFTDCHDRFLTVSGLPANTSMSTVVEAFEKQGKVTVCGRGMKLFQVEMIVFLVRLVSSAGQIAY